MGCHLASACLQPPRQPAKLLKTYDPDLNIAPGVDKAGGILTTVSKQACRFGRKPKAKIQRKLIAQLSRILHLEELKLRGDQPGP